MPRSSLSPEFLARLQADSVVAFLLADLELDSGALRVSTLSFPCTWNGNEYLGVGGIAGIEPITETSNGARGLSFTMPLVNGAAIAAALTEDVQGRRITLRYAVVDTTTEPPTLRVDANVWRGALDTRTVSGLYEPDAKVTVTAEHEMFAWDVPRILRFSDEDQQRRHPGDGLFKHAASMVNKRIRWPSKSWYEK